MNIHQIAEYLNQRLTGFEEKSAYDCLPITGDVDVLQVTVIGREELPIFISNSEDQILCICYLWDESQVIQEKRVQMMETMLEVNIPMPLSSFSKLGEQYVLFGALSVNSSIEDIEHEVKVLSDNSLEVIEELSEFLI